MKTWRIKIMMGDVRTIMDSLIELAIMNNLQLEYIELGEYEMKHLENMVSSGTSNISVEIKSYRDIPVRYNSNLKTLIRPKFIAS